MKTKTKPPEAPAPEKTETCTFTLELMPSVVRVLRASSVLRGGSGSDEEVKSEIRRNLYAATAELRRRHHCELIPGRA